MDSPFCNFCSKIKEKSLCRHIKLFHLLSDEFSGSKMQKTRTTVLVLGFEDKILQSNNVRVTIDCFSQVMHRLFHFIAIGLNTSAFTIKPQETETFFTEANGTFPIDLFCLTVALEHIWATAALNKCSDPVKHIDFICITMQGVLDSKEAFYLC